MAKKKKLNMTIAEADIEFKQSVDTLTEAIAEDLEQYPSELEPFDAYAQRVRAQVVSNVEDFRNRFLEGYSILLHEIESIEKDAETDQDKPPPGTIVL